MDTEAVLAWVDTLVFAKTGERLNTLQRTILQQVLHGKKYLKIAESYGCTEGHVKDVSSQLWRLLSEKLGEKITKVNCRVVLEQRVRTAVLQAVSLAEPEDANFVGRTMVIAHLNTLIQQGSKVIVIQGEGGLGKTTLAQQYLQNQGFDLVLELLMAKETQNIIPATRVVEEWLKQDFQQEPGLEFGVSLERLKRQLSTCRVGVLIDNLEPALDQQGQLIEPHRSYVDLLRVLTDPKVQSITLITSRDRLCEPELNIAHYRLPGLDWAAWQQFFGNRLVSIDLPTLQMMHHAYGGNAKAMGILCGSIQQEFDGDMTAYWQENHADPLAATDLKNLVVSQINRLQVLDPTAHRLLCRLGCYRYQDVPTIPTQGLLCLLWEVPDSQRRQIVASLRNRSLVEFHQGNYWLHPVIRTEAIARLRASDEWETVNHRIAEFWTESIQTINTTKDALQALEAYYHYVAINEFDLAGKVILKSRNNQWQQFLPLGSTLYRLGLIQPVFTAITHVIHNSQSDHNLSELYNILGDIYWISGKIHLAVKCQEKVIAITTQSLETLETLVHTREHKLHIYYLKMLKVDSLLSMGLYQIDLWELTTAAQLFQEVISIAENTEHHRWAEKATVCLALINCFLGLREKSYSLANDSYDSLLNKQPPEQTGRLAYFIQILGQTYVQLGDFEKANEICCQALLFAEASHYFQVKAKTLVSLAEMYRQQEAFELALANHTEAIELMDKIGAKCDLAEAYFQLGITYQKLKKLKESEINFNQAIRLFTEMEAPKQVEKVKRQLTKALDILSQQ